MAGVPVALVVAATCLPGAPIAERRPRGHHKEDRYTYISRPGLPAVALDPLIREVANLVSDKQRSGQCSTEQTGRSGQSCLPSDRVDPGSRFLPVAESPSPSLTGWVRKGTAQRIIQLPTLRADLSGCRRPDLKLSRFVVAAPRRSTKSVPNGTSPGP